MLFSANELLTAGTKIGQGLSDFVEVVFTLPKRLQFGQEKRAKEAKGGKEERISVKMIATKSERGTELSFQAQELLQEIMDEEQQRSKSEGEDQGE